MVDAPLSPSSANHHHADSLADVGDYEDEEPLQEEYDNILDDQTDTELLVANLNSVLDYEFVFEVPRSPTPSSAVLSSSNNMSLPKNCFRSSSDTSSDEDEEHPLADDTRFVSRDEIYDEADDQDQNNYDLLSANADDLEDYPPAFYEHPLLRTVYIRGFIEAAMNHATHESIKSQLDTHHAILQSCVRQSDLEIPGLENMACTLRTVERRLGVDPDQYIVYHFICNVCWYRHHPTELQSLQSPSCTQEDCPGQLYTIKRLAGGLKCSPTKLLPYCPIIPQIQRLLLRPGKYEEYQHWRKEGDEPGPIPPLRTEGRDAFNNPTTPMEDFYDGWAWRAAQAGLERRRTGKWGVEDVDVKELNQY